MNLERAMKLRSKLSTILDRAIDIMAIIAGVLLIGVIVIVCLEVFLRYFLNSPTLWVVEVSAICLVYITFLCAAWVLKREGHVKMEVVIDRLKPRARAFLGIVSSIIGIGICFIFVWYGTQVTWEQWLSGDYRYTNLETPNYIVNLIIPVGSFFFLIQFMRRAFKYFGEFRVPPEPKQEAVVEVTKQA